MANLYSRVFFENKPSKKTPLSAEVLNILDKGIYDVATALEELEAVGISTSGIQSAIEDYMSEHGIFDSELSDTATNAVQNKVVTKKIKSLSEEIATKADQKNIVYVTPEKYGAKGDGVTDDSAAVEQAMNAELPCFLASTYLIASPIEVSNGERTKVIYGMGHDAALRIAATGSITFNHSRTKVKNVRFRCLKSNDTTTDDFAVTSKKSYFTVFEDCDFVSDGRPCLSLSYCAYTYIEKTGFMWYTETENVTVGDYKYQALLRADGEYLYINNSNVQYNDSPKYTTSLAGFVNECANDVYITNSDFANFTTGKPLVAYPRANKGVTRFSTFNTVFMRNYESNIHFDCTREAVTGENEFECHFWIPTNKTAVVATIERDGYNAKAVINAKLRNMGGSTYDLTGVADAKGTIKISYLLAMGDNIGTKIIGSDESYVFKHSFTGLAESGRITTDYINGLIETALVNFAEEASLFRYAMPTTEFKHDRTIVKTSALGKVILYDLTDANMLANLTSSEVTLSSTTSTINNRPTAFTIPKGATVTVEYYDFQFIDPNPWEGTKFGSTKVSARVAGGSTNISSLEYQLTAGDDGLPKDFSNTFTADSDIAVGCIYMLLSQDVYRLHMSFKMKVIVNGSRWI